MFLIRHPSKRLTGVVFASKQSIIVYLAVIALAAHATPLVGQEEIIYESADPSLIIEYPEGIEGTVVVEEGNQFSDIIDGNFIQLAPDYSREMLDFQNRQTNKEILLLEHALNSNGQTNMTLGAQFRASSLYGKTNQANKFPYLGRFRPTWRRARALGQEFMGILKHSFPTSSRLTIPSKVVSKFARPMW